MNMTTMCIDSSLFECELSRPFATLGVTLISRKQPMADPHGSATSFGKSPGESADQDGALPPQKRSNPLCSKVTGAADFRKGYKAD
jgi:hypothetical protein